MIAARKSRGAAVATILAGCLWAAPLAFSQETSETNDGGAGPPHDLILKPADPGRTLQETPGNTPAGELERSAEGSRKSGAYSRDMMNLQLGPPGNLETVVPYDRETVLSGPEFTLFGGRYGFRIELGRPRSLPWESVPPPIDLTGNMDDLQQDPDELDDVLWLPLLQIGFL